MLIIKWKMEIKGEWSRDKFDVSTNYQREARNN